MAKVTLEKCSLDSLTYICPSGHEYAFNKGQPLEIGDANDVSHFQEKKGGSFVVGEPKKKEGDD